MNTSSFDILVIGNETAGLWLLRRYLEITKLVPEASAKKAGWVRFADRPSSTFLPATLAIAFGIDTEPGRSREIEMITPSRVFRWNHDFLLSQGVETKAIPVSPSRSDWQLLAKHLMQRPELLGFASGIWKWVGLSPKTSAERMFWASLLCHRYQNLDASSLVAEEVEVHDQSLPQSCTKMEWQKNKKWLLEFSDGRVVEATELLFNCSVSDLSGRFPADVLNKYLPNPAINQEPGLFAVRWTLSEKDSPNYLQPLSFLFETEEIPDPLTEILPITVETVGEEKQISVWCESEEQVPDAEAKMKALLPALSKASNHEVLPAIRRNRSASVLLSSSTRHPRLHYFGPELLAQYPFPLGPLLSAQECVRHVLGRKILRQAQQVLDKRV